MGGLGLIKSLAEKERELAARLEAAKKEAADLFRQAEAEAKALLEAAETQAQALEAEYREKEVRGTEAVMSRYRAQAEAEVLAVKERAQARLDEAVALVLKEVLP
ncbi:V-type ATPase subunit subunit G family protein [Thermus sediminis]|uniref:V-type ATPase subunit subunit G family protein n=1 Tax=Thermus sediminis TaxID=1761908 RepID=UPI000E3BD9F6|nr:V-type ATPase subunit subunit G family protein [Thermus sediminis]